MTVCFFGNYQKDYPRNHVIAGGLRKNGINIIECHTRKRGIQKYISLYRKHRTVKRQYDILHVAFSGHTLIWFAKLITRKPVVFDAFVSLYLTNVEDRKTVSQKSFRARYFAFLDWLSCRMADRVLLDTDAQIEYFVRRYGISKEKFVKVYVGAKEDIFFPKMIQRSDNTFIVHWHGYIVPFYSLETILLAANILKDDKDIRFHLVTRFNGKYYEILETAKKLHLDNVEFFPETTYEKISEYINRADLCLGIFGKNQKAGLVIPNKIFEAIACAKPVITSRQKAVEEVFEDQKNILFTNPEDPKDLAEKIRFMKNNPAFAESIGRNAHELFQDRFISKNVVKNLIPFLGRMFYKKDI